MASPDFSLDRLLRGDLHSDAPLERWQPDPDQPPIDWSAIRQAMEAADAKELGDMMERMRRFREILGRPWE